VAVSRCRRGCTTASIPTEGGGPITDPQLVTTQRLPARRVRPYRKDFPADPQEEQSFVELETTLLTDEVPTTMTILCTQPFRLRYTHPRDQDSYIRYPVDPLPMGVPIMFRDLDWSQIHITPTIYPARLRIFSQANEHVSPPPGAQER